MVMDGTVDKLIVKRRLVTVFFALGAVLAANSSQAAPKITEAEVAMLPEYCAARFSGLKSMAYQTWSDRLGAENFGHIHHYCYGLNFMNRAMMEFDPKQKRNSLKRAIRNFDYVLRHWGPEFSLTPSAMIYRQQAEMSLSMME